MFWGVELAFQRVPGVVKTEVGYTQGNMHNPSYEKIVSGTTGHVEAVKIRFDPAALTFSELLDFYWDIIDPTTLNAQGDDAGTHFRTGIYYNTEVQREIAEHSKSIVQKNYSTPIVTEIKPAMQWYPADDYMQQYLMKEGQSANKGDLTPIRHYG